MRSAKLFVAVLIISLMGLLAPAASAQEYYHELYDVNGGVCTDLMPGGEWVGTSRVRFNVPAGSVVIMQFYFNGSFVSDDLITYPTDTTDDTTVYILFSGATFPFTAETTFSLQYQGEVLFSQHLRVECLVDGAPAIITLTTNRGVTGGIDDGRLCFWDDYAVYTDGDSINVYGIFNQTGYFILSVSADELAAHPGEEGVNTLIASSEDGLVQVYRLETSDTYQVHTGLDFVRFNGLPASDVACGRVELP